MVKIQDFPLELTARVFEEMKTEDAWRAREVCRYWHQAFEFCAYGSNSVYLHGISVSVDVICGLLPATTSKAGSKFLDRHIVHGELQFDSSAGASRGFAKWVSEKRRYEAWPGGRWRQHSIGEVLTDVELRFTGLVGADDARIHFGTDITFTSRVSLTNGITRYVDSGAGKFNAFLVSIDTLTEPAANGKANYKHALTAFSAPMWQIYALLARHIRSQREHEELVRRHYFRTSILSFRQNSIISQDHRASDSMGEYFAGLQDYRGSIGACY
jgi:hypothetical protein